MNAKSSGALVKYAAAFAGGYVGALIPILAAGDLPGQKALIAALAAGILATGLFHCPGPAVGTRGEAPTVKP